MADSGLTRRIRPSDLEEDPAEHKIRERQRLLADAILLERAAAVLRRHDWRYGTATASDLEARAARWRRAAEAEPS